VQTTIVNGKVLMRNRKVLPLDRAAILRETKTWGGKVSAAGRALAVIFIPCFGGASPLLRDHG